MKISYMLQREDFYKVNQETLDNYYTENSKGKKLYIYPELNAIVTSAPSRKVKEYLYVEYNVKSSFLKKTLVKLYTKIALNTERPFLQQELCKVKGILNNKLSYLSLQ